MNDIMLQGGDRVPICMTSNAEVCMRKHDKGGRGGGRGADLGKTPHNRDSTEVLL